MNKKLSVVLAVRNEEENIGRCLLSVKSIADEIIIFDEKSIDKTAEIAKKLGARIYEVEHEDNFHITKQKAIDAANGDWILQLDADEVITPELSEEIKELINSSNDMLLTRLFSRSTFNGQRHTKKHNLFIRHQQLIELRDGKIGKQTGEVVAFFIPRINMFLGKPLVHAGVYPDPAIRLIKRGKAHLPAKSVHEIMQVDGEIGWLYNSMEHYDSPTLSRYLMRMNRYTDLQAEGFKTKKLPKNIWQFFLYTVHRPLSTFLSLYFRHLGILDGMQGFLWSFFSALHFPLAYYKYWIDKH